MSRRLAPLAALAATALALTACGSASSSATGSSAPAESSPAADAAASSPAAESPAAESSAAGPTVVVTTSILGDVVGRIVACGGGTTTVLMPNGTDPHDFTPSSAQVADLVSADLVVANGLGLEAGLEEALAGAQSDGTPVLSVAPELDPIPFGSAHGHADEEAHADEEHADEDAHADEEHAHGDLDPHVWFDMTRMATAAGLVGDRLAEATGNDAYIACAEEVAASLTATEAEVRAALESVPAQQRVLVTDHEALGYLADAYGYEVAGTVIPSGSTLAEPSSADLAALAQTIRDEGVPVIFANVSQPGRLAEAVAAEAGTDVAVVPLFVESLGEAGTDAATYEGMMLANARTIAESLQP